MANIRGTLQREWVDFLNKGAEKMKEGDLVYIRGLESRYIGEIKSIYKNSDGSLRANVIPRNGNYKGFKRGFHQNVSLGSLIKMEPLKTSIILVNERKNNEIYNHYIKRINERK